jgi:hypothetical protein
MLAHICEAPIDHPFFAAPFAICCTNATIAGFNEQREKQESCRLALSLVL